MGDRSRNTAVLGSEGLPDPARGSPHSVSGLHVKAVLLVPDKESQVRRKEPC